MDLCKEIELLIKIDHRNIVNIYEYYLYTNDVFIVMEYLNGGELFDKIIEDQNYLTENYIRKMMKEIIGAISYLHAQNIGKNNSILIKSPLRFKTGKFTS